jgi:hypothetical protein
MTRTPRLFAACLLLSFSAPAQTEKALADRARQYLVDLIRLDTTNPPGRETKVANYLKKITEAEAIPSELLGGDPARVNFVAAQRLRLSAAAAADGPQ